jgi:hypothetical protein
MKLPLPFKRDAATRLRAETAASASAAAKLAELRTERDRILHNDTDDLAGVVAADAAVSAQEAIVRVHQQRLQSLDAELRNERQAEREKRKTEAVAVLEKNFARRTRTAAELEAALANLAACYMKYLEANRSATTPWPSDLFPQQRGQYAINDNLGSWLAATLRIEAASAHVMISEAGVRTAGIAEREASFAAGFIQSLREAPVPDEQQLDDEVAA